MNIQLNEEILNFLLEYRSQHPEFTFATRVKNSKNKLDEGYWFQGTENYIFVGFYKLGDSKSKTKTIGFVIELRDGAVVNNHISIVYPMDLSEQVVLLHKRIKEKIDSLHILQLKETWKDKRYEFFFENTDWKENLSLFLDKIQPVIDTEIRTLHFEKEMYISDDIFKHNLSIITSVKSTTDYENLLKLLRRIGQDASQKYFDYANKLVTNLNVSEGDIRVSYTCQGFKRLAIIIGHRYCFVYISDDSMGMNWHFILQEKVQKENIQQRDVFKETNGVISAYYQATDDGTNIGLLFDGIFEASKFELERTNKSHNRKSNLEVFEKAIFDKDFRRQIFELAFPELPKSMNKYPLNQILYGPPGTGKTHNSIKIAVIIANPKFIGTKWNDIKTEFDRLVESGQVVFTTFHQSMSYEDFIEGIKPITDDEAGTVTYEVQKGIFKLISEDAQKNLQSSSEIPSKLVKTDFDTLWGTLIEQISATLESGKVFELPTLTNKAFEVVSISDKGNLKVRPLDNGQREYTVSYRRTKKLFEAFPSLSGISNIDKEFRNIIGGANSTSYWSVLNYLQKSINIKPTPTNEEQKNFVIVIDEINRGNVSQIFGELITLIEEDKRESKPEALKITLPYSKEKFSVPSNLYIIGTMNTADRSVEALDTALRRRFSFEEMPPKYDLEGFENEIIQGITRTNLLTTINLRLEKLLDKDHLIGHSFFICKEGETPLEKIKDTFYKNIFPLLQEYFYGDYGKIGLILGKGFVRKKESTENSIFADFEDYDSNFDDRIVYEIIDYRKDTKDTFENALKILMK